MTAAQGDSFLLQDRVLDAVTGLLDVELETHELDAMRAYGTQVPEAYYLYLQGRGHLERLDRDSDIDRAISTFGRVLDLDPDYALAHAGLGSAYRQKHDQTNQPDWALQAAAECRKAVDLDERRPRVTSVSVSRTAAWDAMTRPSLSSRGQSPSSPRTQMPCAVSRCATSR